MQLNLVVILSIVWLVSYILFLSVIASAPIPDGIVEIVKMAVTGLFGIVTGAAGAMVAMNRRATDEAKPTALAPEPKKEG